MFNKNDLVRIPKRSGKGNVFIKESSKVGVSQSLLSNLIKHTTFEDSDA